MKDTGGAVGDVSEGISELASSEGLESSELLAIGGELKFGVSESWKVMRPFAQSTNGL